jgi:hypothetical protein
MHEPGQLRRQDRRGKSHGEEQDTGDDPDGRQCPEEMFPVHTILRLAFEVMKVPTRGWRCREASR